jgi:Zn-dependent metalloprotease
MTHGRFVTAVVAAVVLAIIVPVSFQALQGAPQQSGPTIGQALVVRETSSRTGLPSFASADGDGLSLGVSANLPAESRALAFLGFHGNEFGIDRAGVQLQRAPTVDLLGVEHVRFQQVHFGVPVTAGEFVVHLRGSRVVAANGNVLTDLPSDVTPEISAQAALDGVSALLSRHRSTLAAEARFSTPRLEIFNRGMIGPASVGSRLAWFVEATGPSLREYAWIDAKNGALLLNFSQLTDARNRQTYDGMNTSALPGTLARSEGAANVGDADIDNAHNYAGDTYDYYFTNHGRDSYDGAGAMIISTVRHCPPGEPCPMQNAFWNGTQMAYGAGFSQADDVVGHELTHAVTENSSNLFYYYQSGAINEALSDIFGETVDLTNVGGTDTPGVRWLMGEDVPGFGAIRNMMNPNAFGDPGKVSDPQYHCDPSDGGGVHFNSGVVNHAFALMVDGGTYNGRTIAGIGLTKAGKIWYRIATVYLTSGSNFVTAGTSLSQACLDLIGTAGITAADCTQVQLAVDAVEMKRPPSCPSAVAMPTGCPNSAPPNASFFFSNFDTFPSVPEWSISSTTGTNWGVAGFYATSGLYSGFGPNIGSTSDHRLVFTNAVLIPAGARLAFRHAFEVEYDATNNYDGGVLEYSTDGGTVWNDVVTGPAGNMIIAGQTYNGTIYNNPGDPTSTNPLKGRPAFVRHSSGYTGTILDLAPLAGQNVKFRWRMGTDAVAAWLGWFVDDVRIYTCPGAANGEMVLNGSFTGGTGGWSVFGLPSVPQGIVWDNTGDRFNYYRPPGSVQGVVLQNTGLSLPEPMSLEAVWTMANTDLVRKRYSVLIGDNDFTDLHVCTFWLDPGQPAQTYRMRTHTNRPIGNLTIWFYAASVNGAANTATYQLDNVSMTLKPTHSAFKTDCEDPLRPTAGGSTSGNLMVNGDFASGLAPWTPFGQISHNSAAGGVFEFFKLAGAPAGVLLQSTGQAMDLDQRIQATFQLGNSSGVRQRVTVILHEAPSFSDLSACTFWLPPGLPMQTYTMRTYASQAWTNATFAVYPATVGTAPSHQWLRLDNVNLQRVTSANWGTECFEPGS